MSVCVRERDQWSTLGLRGEREIALALPDYPRLQPQLIGQLLQPCRAREAVLDKLGLQLPQLRSRVNTSEEGMLTQHSFDLSPAEEWHYLCESRSKEQPLSRPAPGRVGDLWLIIISVCEAASNNDSDAHAVTHTPQSGHDPTS